MPRDFEIPTMQVRPSKLRDHIQHMQDHALIGKFVGLQPSEKALVWWINSTWKPKGHFDLQLGSKGFFTIIFFNMEGRDRVMDVAPYFFYST